MSSIEYQPPTDLNGAYDPVLLEIPLSWTASVDGIPELFTSSGNYIVDPTADHVQVTGIGAGGGGTSSTNQAESGNVGSFGGYGGGGGAYAQATFSISGLVPGPVAVTIDSVGGAGGAATTSDIIGVNFNYGVAGIAGGDTIFGAILTAGGGAGGPIGSLGTPTPAPGGVATIVGGSSITTEVGGTGAWLSCPNVTTSIAAGASTLAGAGGGAGAIALFGIQDGLVGGTAGAVPGGTFGTSVIYPTGNIAGPGAPGASQSGILGGSGGGGGGYATIGAGNAAVDFTAGQGGAGGFPGGGGAGSGMAVAFLSGGGPSHHQFAFGAAGGNGAPGELETITFWLHTHDPQYIVYRNGVPVGVTAQGVTTFVDLAPLAGANTYTVYASYDGTSLNSAASDPFTVTVSLGKTFVSGKFSPANAFAPIMMINLKGVKPRFYVPVINSNMRSRR